MDQVTIDKMQAAAGVRAKACLGGIRNAANAVVGTLAQNAKNEGGRDVLDGVFGANAAAVATFEAACVAFVKALV